MIQVLILAGVYIAAVHFAYAAYIYPVFEYAHYIYLPVSNAALLFTYLLSLLPVVALRRSSQPAQAIVALIYTMSFVPIQLSLLFTVELKYENLFWIQSMLSCSMIVLFLAAKGSMHNNAHYQCWRSSHFQSMDWVVGMATAISLVLLVVENLGHMRFVSFADVYDLRFDSSGVPQSAVSGYLISWVSYCFVFYFYARGLVHRKWVFILVGLAASILLYMSTGTKLGILSLPIALGLSWLWGTGRNFLARLLLSMIMIIALLVLALPDDGVGMWIKSIFLVRIIGTAGWAASKYLEYFSAEGLTYYSHVGPINALTGIYPFGNLSLGQLIGLQYSGSVEANFNASFWASDGFAALGPVGVIVVTPVVAGVLIAVNRSMSSVGAGFVIPWMAGFIMALLNMPISTALLSGGGLIIIGQAWWLSRKINLRRGVSRMSSSPIFRRKV